MPALDGGYEDAVNCALPEIPLQEVYGMLENRENGLYTNPVIAYCIWALC